MQPVVVVLKAIKVCKGGRATRIVESGSAAVRMKVQINAIALGCNRAESLVP